MEARKQVDKLACEAWKGPTPPSPTIGDAINAGYFYLEVRCLGCDTNQTVALDIIRRGKTTPVHELDVVFQEVVHLVRTEEAEVAKLQCSTERPDEQPKECSPDAERSRGHGAVCGSGTEQCTPPRASSTPRRRWWPNGSNGRTICATFWLRLHRCPRAAAWPSAYAGSRTPAHISSSVIAFEEASLLMPVYRWVASRSRMICGGITWATPGTASGASHHSRLICTTLCRYQGIP